MAMIDPVNNTAYFGFMVPINQNEVAGPHFLLMNLTSKPQLNFLQILIKILGVDPEPP